LRAQVTQIWRLLDANGVKVPKGTGELVLKQLLFMDIGVSINGCFHKWWINGFPSDKPPFGVSINILNGGYPNNWIMENPTEMDDLGVPLFLGHRHINGKMHIHKLFFVHFWAGIKDSPSVYQGSSWSIMVFMMVYHGLEHHVLYKKHGFFCGYDIFVIKTSSSFRWYRGHQLGVFLGEYNRKGVFERHNMVKTC